MLSSLVSLPDRSVNMNIYAARFTITVLSIAQAMLHFCMSSVKLILTYLKVETAILASISIS